MKIKLIYIFVGVMALAMVQLACSAATGSSSTPTVPAVAPAATVDSSSSGSCPALKLATPKPSGLVTGVTMAKDTQGDNKDPVDPTTAFSPTATFHAVVAVKDAPTDTAFKSTWYATDTNGAADCNTKIDEYELKTDGSRNIDFTLAPKETWPAGTYRVEIQVNGVLESITNFTVVK